MTTDLTTAVQLQWQVEQFLYGEAALLDGRAFVQWTELLDPAIEYRVPVRVTRERANAHLAFSDDSFHMIEDYGSLTTRMRRFDTEHAWSENPPSRTRRLVSNVRVQRLDDGSLRVDSNLLFCWSRGEAASVVLSAAREDVLVETADGLRLAGRTVYLDHDSLPIPNLAVPL